MPGTTVARPTALAVGLLALLAPARAAPAAQAPPPAVPAAERTSITIVARAPAGTPPDATLTLGTDLFGWNLADPRARFSPGPDGTRTLVLSDVPLGATLRYKLTRGSWETVEKNADGSELPDRRLEVGGPSTVVVDVARWADTPGVVPRPTSTVVGNVEILKAVQSPELNLSRDVLVYLPPSYRASPGRRYPVLYMQDGQNVFDASTSFAGREWRADETAETLAARGLEAILVAVFHGNAARMTEYNPFDPAGAAYARFLARTLKPMVDARYRTLREPARTGVLGSSMGGLISLYAALSYPDVFGFAGVMSPSVQLQNGRILGWARARPPGRLRIYLDTGTGEAPLAAESDLMVRRVRALADTLEKGGNDVRLVVAEGAAHAEDAWAERFPGALEWFIAGG